MLTLFRNSLTVRVLAPIALLLTVIAVLASAALSFVTLRQARTALQERAQMVSIVYPAVQAKRCGILMPTRPGRFWHR